MNMNYKNLFCFPLILLVHRASSRTEGVFRWEMKNYNTYEEEEEDEHKKLLSIQMSVENIYNICICLTRGRHYAS